MNNLRLRRLVAPDVGLQCMLLTTWTALWPKERLVPLAFVLITFGNTQYGYGPYLFSASDDIDNLVYKAVLLELNLSRRHARAAFGTWFMSSMYESHASDPQLLAILQVVHWTVEKDWQQDESILSSSEDQ